jgi:DNA-binding sugar fermentation-stimulating protein
MAPMRPDLIPGRLVRRYRRFLADVEPTGGVETVVLRGRVTPKGKEVAGFGELVLRGFSPTTLAG